MDILRAAWLKNELITADSLEIANATYCLGHVAFGDLQAIGAGVIGRKYDRNGDLTEYNFTYCKTLNGEAVKAKLIFGDNILDPGETYYGLY
jgi:hypothetical protein